MARPRARAVAAERESTSPARAWRSAEVGKGNGVVGGRHLLPSPALSGADGRAKYAAKKHAALRIPGMRTSTDPHSCVRGLKLTEQMIGMPRAIWVSM